MAGLGIVFNIEVRDIGQSQVQAKNNIVVTGPAPIINSVTGNPNPSIESQTVQFSASVDFGTLIHGIAWYVNGTLIASYNSGPYGTNPVPTSVNYTFNFVGSFTVEVEASNNYGSSTKTYTQHVNAGPAPEINSVNSSTNPSYVGQEVYFNTSVNWEGYSGSLSYFINGSKISGTSYLFNMSGVYNVTVMANSIDGSSSTASYTQVIRPIVFLSTNVMNTPSSINITVPTNYSSPNNPTPLKSYNLTNSTSIMYYGQNSTLSVSRGIYNNTTEILLDFNMTTATWNVNILYALVLNQTSDLYSGMLIGDVSPVTNPVGLGDVLIENFTGTVAEQLSGIQNGISLLSSRYKDSGNVSLQTFDGYYGDLSSAFSEFIGLVPQNVSDLVVGHSLAIVYDYNLWACLEAWALYFGTAAGLIAEGATIIGSGGLTLVLIVFYTALTAFLLYELYVAINEIIEYC